MCMPITLNLYSRKKSARQAGVYLLPLISFRSDKSQSGKMQLLRYLAWVSSRACSRHMSTQKSAFYRALKPPLAVLVTCMDGRLLPSRLFKAEGGELLIIRNPGNFLPHASSCDPTAAPSEGGASPFASGEMAGVQLAIQKMAIPDIIVCGHSECRAGEALRNLAISRPTGSPGSGSQHSLELLNHWLRSQGSPTLEKYQRHAEDRARGVAFGGGGRKGAGIEATIDEEGKLSETDRLAQINVLQQLEHLQSYDFVHSRLETDQLRLHATFYDLHTSTMQVFNHASSRFVSLPTDDIASLTHYIFQLRLHS